MTGPTNRYFSNDQYSRLFQSEIALKADELVRRRDDYIPYDQTIDSNAFFSAVTEIAVEFYEICGMDDVNELMATEILECVSFAVGNIRRGEIPHLITD